MADDQNPTAEPTSPPVEVPAELAPPPPPSLEAPPEPESAHTPVYEPISEPQNEPVLEPASQTPAAAEPAQSEPAEVPKIEETSKSPPPQVAPRTNTIDTSREAAREKLTRARARRQTNMEEKIGAIVAALEERGSISNKDVKSLVHCSEASATRYLSRLVKQGKIVKKGKGRGVVYVKV